MLSFTFYCPLTTVSRVMDEFDVFMDAVSRDVAIKQVLDHAKRDKSRQLILITPQVLSALVCFVCCC